MEILGVMLAGLGLFFVGIKTLTENLRELTGRRFRRMLERSTRSPMLSAFGGALIGATMQTGSTITFVLVGMVGAGMISVKRSLPIRLGAAIGTSTMIFFATLDISLFILFLLGIAGISLAQSRTRRPALNVLFGGGLMFFGLQMVGSSAVTLSEIAWLKDVILTANDFALAAFMLGVILSVVVQSPQSVAILAIAMTLSGVLDSWTTMVIIYGSNVGGGISTYLLSSGFKGTSRQIMIFQVLFNVLTGIVLLVLFYVERDGGIPLVHHLVTSMNVKLAQQMAFVYLVFNVFGAVMMYMFRTPILHWIEQRWPSTPEEDIGKLEYLHDRVIHIPDLALELVDKEEKRFYGLLAHHIEALRLPVGKDRSQGEVIANALEQLHNSIEDSIADIGQQVGTSDSERLLELVNCNHLLGTLHSSLIDFSGCVRAAKKSPNLELLATEVIEAFDAMFGFTVDACIQGGQEELQQAWTMTDDKSEQMRAVRNRFLSGGAALSDDERLDLLALTNGLERTVWVTHEFIADLLTLKNLNPSEPASV